MSSILLGLGLLLFGGPEIGPGFGDDDPQLEYTCQAPVWIKEPGFYRDGVPYPDEAAPLGAILTGAISFNCHFKGLADGGLPGLQNGLRDEILTRSHQVHAGPVAEIYADLPSEFFDITVAIEAPSEGTSYFRQDVHVATDLATRLKFDAFSTDINGAGYVSYLKKADALSEVTPTTEFGWWDVAVVSEFKIEKPALIPGGFFKREVKAKTEENLPRAEKELIARLAPKI